MGKLSTKLNKLSDKKQKIILMSMIFTLLLCTISIFFKRHYLKHTPIPVSKFNLQIPTIKTDQKELIDIIIKIQTEYEKLDRIKIDGGDSTEIKKLVEINNQINKFFRNE